MRDFEGGQKFLAAFFFALERKTQVGVIPFTVNRTK